jgi:hypothetical protein
MHKDVAKKPGRSAQKRHATFTKQAAERLADRHMIDFVYNHLLPQPGPEETPPNANCASKFFIDISTDPSLPHYNCQVTGVGTLSALDLTKVLYPGLLEFITVHITSNFDIQFPHRIHCCSEAVDEDGNLYRAHQNFRGTGFWHDWAMASFLKDEDEDEDEFANVPVKILCFLPKGIPGNSDVHVVCHPCKWRCTRLTPIVYKWILVPETEATVNGIPYDIIPISALVSPCLVIPDLAEPGVVLEVIKPNLWPDKFVVY